MIKAIIFDMDGVLIDSEPLWFKAGVKIYKNLGFNLTQSKYNETIGMRFDLAVNHWFKQFPWDGSSVKEVQDLILKKVEEVIKKEGQVMEGVNQVLPLLKTNNLKLSLASSSPLHLIKVILQKLNLQQYFDSILSGQFESNPKPHPDIFLNSAKQLKVKPSECLVIEDSVLGVTAAQRASMKCIAIVKNKSIATKKKYPANYYMTSLKEFNQNFLDKIINQ